MFEVCHSPALADRPDAFALLADRLQRAHAVHLGPASVGWSRASERQVTPRAVAEWQAAQARALFGHRHHGERWATAGETVARRAVEIDPRCVTAVLELAEFLFDLD